MKLGTENKRNVAVLGGLGLVAVYLFYTNVLSSPAGTPPAHPAAQGPPPSGAPPAASLPTPFGAAKGAPAAGPNIRRAAPGRGKGDEFHPAMRSKRPEDRVDPATIDPTLRLDLLAKVQGLGAEGGTRNIFQFSVPAAPVAKLVGKEPKVMPRMQGPKTAAEFSASRPPAPVKPPPPPINLKYYGFSSPPGGGRRTAFFLDGDDILVAREGETLKRRYKVVRIGTTSVVMEDTEAQHQQTLPLQADVTGV
jgi:hypothetical protein